MHISKKCLPLQDLAAVFVGTFITDIVLDISFVFSYSISEICCVMTKDCSAATNTKGFFCCWSPSDFRVGWGT